jgi:RND family efflux transporter MFP subunit
MLKVPAQQAPESAAGVDDSPTVHTQHWLATQCGMISHCVGGGVYLCDGGGATIVARWPDADFDPGVSSETIQKIRQDSERAIQMLPGEAGGTRLLQPIRLYGSDSWLLVVLDVDTRDQAELKVIGNLLGWGAEWLPIALKGAQDRRGYSRDVFPLLAICLDQSDFQSLATTLVTQLAQRFNCQRVSLGLRKRRQTEVVVLSHSARFKQEANLLRSIALAMDEAIDQDGTVRYPIPDDVRAGLSYAHESLAKESGDGSILTLPFSHHDDMLGALTLERDSDKPFDDKAGDLLERTMAVISPVMLLMRREQMGFLQRASTGAVRSLKTLIGPAHYRLKLLAITFASLSLFFSVATGTWRVTADAVVEGRVQRAIAAPVDGFIATADARAGDVVEQGQLLGSLDDGDLNLERLKWATLRQQMISESREAVAEGNRAEVSIISARIDQADAELELLDEQLARTRITAPFSGVVIEGDLSQRLGAPVTRGEVLFQVAPMDDFRVVLKIDERDIAEVSEGKSGVLVLASMPDRQWPLRVDRITSVSTPEGGNNYFRVEASLPSSDVGLRPGMEGVGKVELGEARLIWIWSRELVAWLKLKTWTWWR